MKYQELFLLSLLPALFPIISTMIMVNYYNYINANFSIPPSDELIEVSRNLTIMMKLYTCVFCPLALSYPLQDLLDLVFALRTG